MASLKERVCFWRREPDRDVIREELMTEAMILSTQLPEAGRHSGSISTEIPAHSKLLDLLCVDGQVCLELGVQVIDPNDIIVSVRTNGISVYVQIRNGVAIVSSHGLPNKEEQDGWAFFEAIVNAGKMACQRQKRLDGRTSTS